MKQSVYIINTPPLWLKTPPLSLVYLKNYVESKGYRASVLDLNQIVFTLLRKSIKDWLTLDKQFEQDLFSIAYKQHPGLFEKLLESIGDHDVIGFSVLKRNYSFALNLAELIRKTYPQKKIVFGGPEALMLDREQRLDPRFFWIIGEGEKPLVRLLQGCTVQYQRFDEIGDLDKLSFLDFGPLISGNYSSYVPLLSSRGCPNHCNFCSERLLHKKFKFHSPGYMIDHIRYLAEKHTTKNFVFLDSMINYSCDWLDCFCDGLIKKDLRIHWEAQLRVAKDFPLDLAKRMKKSGCFNLFIGLESASDETLRNMNKNFDIQTALEFFTVLKRAGLQFELSLILGYPGESETAFKETLDFVIRNKSVIPKIAQVNPFLDYLNAFPGVSHPTIESTERVSRFIAALDNERIRYTRSFINNLIY